MRVIIGPSNENQDPTDSIEVVDIFPVKRSAYSGKAESAKPKKVIDQARNFIGLSVLFSGERRAMSLPADCTFRLQG